MLVLLLLPWVRTRPGHAETKRRLIHTVRSLLHRSLEIIPPMVKLLTEKNAETHSLVADGKRANIALLA